jgi:MFS-type transporter involved in bile tolerance (Atg22 family)
VLELSGLELVTVFILLIGFVVVAVLGGCTIGRAVVDNKLSGTTLLFIVIGMVALGFVCMCFTTLYKYF